MDTDLHILLHNQAAGKLYNCSDEKLIGKNATVLHQAAGNLKQFEQAIAAAKKDGRHEFVLKQKRDETTRFLATTIFCIRDQENIKTGFGLISLDITDQKQHKASLEAERDFSKKIIDTAPSVICSITPDGTIQFVNPAGEQLTGYSAAELLGKNWQDYFYEGKKGRSTKAMLKTFQEEDVRGHEVRLKTKDGTLCDISWSSVKRFSEKGAFFETLILGNDITGLKKAVEELEKKKKEAEEANIALKVMLDQHTKTRESIEEQISIKLTELVNPYLELLRQSTINDKQTETLSIIAAHIDSITHSFTPKAREILLGFSPRETMIADMIRQGKTSKDIAEILNISLRIVETYRNTLRKKLGINKRKISLRAYLMTHFA